MFSAGKQKTIEETWTLLQDGIDHVLNHIEEGMTYSRYMEIYSAVYDYCTNTKIAQGPITDPAIRGGANLMGVDLYNKLKAHVEAYVDKLRDAAPADDPSNLLRYYAKQWKRYTQSCTLIHHLFRYLNRHWVKREMDEGRRGVYDVYTLALVIWKARFFGTANKGVVEAMLELIRRERDGETIEVGLIKSVVESFVALGLDDLDASKSNLDVYIKHFEEMFVETTGEYYIAESAKYLQENSVTDYMIKAETRLTEEDMRVDLYLNRHTKQPLIKKCEIVLIKDHMSVLQEEFVVLLEQDRNDDLARMYSLLFRVPDGLVPLRERFETHVRRVGTTAVEKVAEEQDPDKLDPKLYVDALLEVHSKYISLVNSSFKADSTFVASLDRACREFVNRNKVCKASSSKSPELIAKYCDQLLKKSAKNPEEAELEQLLNSIMTVFKYVEDKDVFQKFYARGLARRLVGQQSASDDAEASMITKLKDACGFEYTSKLQRMFTDIGVCKDLNQDFKDRMLRTHEESDLTDFYIMVLTQGQWPLTASNTTFNLPQDLVPTYERFTGFYQNKHSGRKLIWLYHHSKGELKANYFKNNKAGFIFQCSMFQMGILMQYNDGTELSWEDLLARTGLPPEQLVGPLQIIVRARVLNAVRSDGSALTEDQVGSPGSKYILNEDFKSKKYRINLNIPIRAEQKQEADDTRKTVDEDRKLVIQAAIVRIMKTRKSMKHVALMDEVINQLSSRFKPKIPDIKKCIETLLEKEFIERKEGEKDAYNYLA